MAEKEKFGALDMVVLAAESTRVYVYSDGNELRIEDVTHLHVSPSTLGGHAHRLRDSKGDMWYVPPGWVAIRFEGLEGWTL